MDDWLDNLSSELGVNSISISNSNNNNKVDDNKDDDNDTISDLPWSITSSTHEPNILLEKRRIIEKEEQQNDDMKEQEHRRRQSLLLSYTYTRDSDDQDEYLQQQQEQNNKDDSDDDDIDTVSDLPYSSISSFNRFNNSHDPCVSQKQEKEQEKEQQKEQQQQQRGSLVFSLAEKDSDNENENNIEKRSSQLQNNNKDDQNNRNTILNNNDIYRTINSDYNPSSAPIPTPTLSSSSSSSQELARSLSSSSTLSLAAVQKHERQLEQEEKDKSHQSQEAQQQRHPNPYSDRPRNPFGSQRHLSWKKSQKSYASFKSKSTSSVISESVQSEVAADVDARSNTAVYVKDDEYVWLPAQVQSDGSRDSSSSKTINSSDRSLANKTKKKMMKDKEWKIEKQHQQQRSPLSLATPSSLSTSPYHDKYQQQQQQQIVAEEEEDDDDDDKKEKEGDGKITVKVVLPEDWSSTTMLVPGSTIRKLESALTMNTTLNNSNSNGDGSNTYNNYNHPTTADAAAATPTTKIEEDGRNIMSTYANASHNIIEEGQKMLSLSAPTAMMIMAQQQQQRQQQSQHYSKQYSYHHSHSHKQQTRKSIKHPPFHYEHDTSKHQWPGGIDRNVKLSDYLHCELPLQNVERGMSRRTSIFTSNNNSLQLAPPTLRNSGDMSDLPFLHEASVLYNLKLRHASYLPYTRVGEHIFVAMNPFVWNNNLYSSIKQEEYANGLIWMNMDMPDIDPSSNNPSGKKDNNNNNNNNMEKVYKEKELKKEEHMGLYYGMMNESKSKSFPNSSPSFLTSPPSSPSKSQQQSKLPSSPVAELRPLTSGSIYSKLELEPHVYEAAALAYRGLAVDRMNQSVLVGGESGAGKTETVKIVMSYLATVEGTRPKSKTSLASLEEVEYLGGAGGGNSPPSSFKSPDHGWDVSVVANAVERRGRYYDVANIMDNNNDNNNNNNNSGTTTNSADVVRRILQSNPVFEAFGNARTAR